MEKRFEELEEKLAYLEMASAELGEEIFRQQKEIDALTKAHRTILERVEVLQDSAAETVMETSEKPPHY